MPGPRDPSLTPYTVPFMRAFTDTRYRQAVMVTAAQSGKTESFLDIIGERLDNRPAPILYVGPSKEFVTDQFEPRLIELFLQSQSLLGKVLGGLDSKRQKQTLKRVAGVRLRLAHAGSSTALKSDPFALALVDEYDEMLANVRGQGDPLGLIQARGDTYADSVVGVTSTPTMGLVSTEIDAATGLEFWAVGDDEDVVSPIWRLWQQGTRHHWCWPCPQCGDYFVPRFKLLQWAKGASPAQARRSSWLACPHCGGIIEESHKAAMNARGTYVAPGQRVGKDGVVSGEAPDTSTLSLWVSGLASPFVTFGERAETYLKAFASNEAAKIQTAVNAGFGEVYTPGGGDVPEWQAIASRKEPYASGSLPAGLIYLTAGIDVQKNRIPFVIRGWGAKSTSWLIEHGELWGDTSQPDIWEDLADKLTEPIEDVLIKLAFLDSGFRPGKKETVPVNRVYDFCRRFRRFVFPTKGASNVMAKPLIKGSIEVTQQGKQAKYGLELIRLDSDHWKSVVHERLAYPLDQPGAFHLHEETTDDYCQQLVAEVRIKGPTGKHVWVQRSKENHYLDAEAMAAAAAYMLNVQHIREGTLRRHKGSAPAMPPAATAAPVGGQARAPDPPSKPGSTALSPPIMVKSRAERFADLALRLNRRL